MAAFDRALDSTLDAQARAGIEALVSLSGDPGTLRALALELAPAGARRTAYAIHAQLFRSEAADPEDLLGMLRLAPSEAEVAGLLREAQARWPDDPRVVAAVGPDGPAWRRVAKEALAPGSADPIYSALRERVAHMALGSGVSSHAAKLFARCLAPGRPDVAASRALALARSDGTNGRGEAHQLLSRLSSEAPGCWQVWQFRTSLAWEEERWAEAERFADAALRLRDDEPDCCDTWSMRADARARLGDLGGALADAEGHRRAANRAGVRARQVDGMLLRAELCVRVGDLFEAARLLEEAGASERRGKIVSLALGCGIEPELRLRFEALAR